MKDNVKTGVQCNIRDKWGHSAKNCWYKKSKRATKGKEKGENFAYHDSDDSHDTVVMAAVVDNHVDSKFWFLDVGCSNHMTG